MKEVKLTHAGLSLRSVSFGLDYIWIVAYIVGLIVLSMIVNLTFPSVAELLFQNALSAQVTGFVLLTVPVALYFSLAETSRWQASWGKRKMHLRIAKTNGQRLGSKRALGRNALKFIPWELAHTCIWQLTFADNPSAPVFTAGFIFVWILIAANIASMIVSPSRQTLYDRFTGTVVLRRR